LLFVGLSSVTVDRKPSRFELRLDTFGDVFCVMMLAVPSALPPLLGDRSRCCSSGVDGDGSFDAKKLKKPNFFF
jgi:hypothetical protein